MRQRQQIDHPADVMRPFLWVGALGFLIGFYGYLAVLPG